MEIGKLCAVAVIAALCALILKKQVPEVALCLSLTAGCLLLWEALDALSAVRGLMDSLARQAGISVQVWRSVVKLVGIGVFTRLGAAVCRDAGEGGVAAFLETAGAALALFTALPLVETVFDTLQGLL